MSLPILKKVQLILTSIIKRFLAFAHLNRTGCKSNFSDRFGLSNYTADEGIPSLKSDL